MWEGSQLSAWKLEKRSVVVWTPWTGLSTHKVYDKILKWNVVGKKYKSSLKFEYDSNIFKYSRVVVKYCVCRQHWFTEDIHDLTRIASIINFMYAILDNIARPRSFLLAPYLTELIFVEDNIFSKLVLPVVTTTSSSLWKQRDILHWTQNSLA